MVAGMMCGPFGIHSEVINGLIHITHRPTGYRISRPVNSIYHAICIVQELWEHYETARCESLEPNFELPVVERIFERVTTSEVTIT